jgi:hypothetical protein
MSFSCPRCKEPLSTEVRPVQLEDGEIVHILEDGTAVISSITCSNDDCDGEREPKPKKKDRTAAASAGEACSKSELCSRQNGHSGRHDTKLAERVEG